MDADAWMRAATSALRAEFGAGVKFVGVRGSFRRGTATAGSDINVVAVFDRVDQNVVARFGAVMGALPHGERVDGLVVAADVLSSWPAHELPLLVADTVTYHGNLEDFLPEIHHEDVVVGARTLAANLYRAVSTALIKGELDQAHLDALNKQAYFTHVMAGAAESGTFDWTLPRPTMDAHQMVAWTQKLLRIL